MCEQKASEAVRDQQRRLVLGQDGAVESDNPICKIRLRPTRGLEALKRAVALLPMCLPVIWARAVDSGKSDDGRHWAINEGSVAHP